MHHFNYPISNNERDLMSSSSTIPFPHQHNFNHHNNNGLVYPVPNHYLSLCNRSQQPSVYRYVPLQHGPPAQFYNSRYISAAPAVLPTPRPLDLAAPFLHHRHPPVCCHCCRSSQYHSSSRCLPAAQPVTLPSVGRTCSKPQCAVTEEVISVELNNNFTVLNDWPLDTPLEAPSKIQQVLVSPFEATVSLPQIPPRLGIPRIQLHKIQTTSNQKCPEDSLPPSPKDLCIALEEDQYKEEAESQDEEAQSEEKILHLNSPDKQKQDGNNEHQLDPFDESFGLITSEKARDRLPFADFMDSPEAKPQQDLCIPPFDNNDISSGDTESRNQLTLPVSIPLSLVSPNSSTSFLTNQPSFSPYVVSIPITVWLEAKRRFRREKRQKKIPLLCQPNAETDRVDKQAVQTLEEVFKDSPLLSSKDAEIIRSFLKGERVGSVVDDLIRFALSKVMDPNVGAQYAAIELDSIRQQWRGIMIDATDIPTTVFHNELSITQ